MTLLDVLRAPARPAGAPGRPDDAVPVSILSRRQLAVLALLAAVLLSGVLALVFGPARGLRTDIVRVSDDLDASRDGIFLQLDTARTQLGLTEQSLEVQEQGLVVAVEAEKDATSAAQATQEILDETRATLQLVREVTDSLGPLDRLGEDVRSVVRDVEQALRVAEQTLRVARQTLETGRQALAVARDTLATLRRSEQVQLQLLEVARETLEQTREINRKTPGAPVFPTTSSPAPSAP